MTQQSEPSYLPTPEEIADETAVFRGRHLERKLQESENGRYGRGVGNIREYRVAVTREGRPTVEEA